MTGWADWRRVKRSRRRRRQCRFLADWPWFDFGHQERPLSKFRQAELGPPGTLVQLFYVFLSVFYYLKNIVIEIKMTRFWWKRVEERNQSEGEAKTNIVWWCGFFFFFELTMGFTTRRRSCGRRAALVPRFSLYNLPARLMTEKGWKCWNVIKEKRRRRGENKSCYTTISSEWEMQHQTE